MVISPGLAKPDSASPGDTTPVTSTITSAAIMVISAGTRLLASAPSTEATISSVITISRFTGRIPSEGQQGHGLRRKKSFYREKDI